MAYGILAGVAPIIGIYTGFFPVLLYVVLGTMPHNSMGTFAVISILVSNPVNKFSHVQTVLSGNITGEVLIANFTNQDTDYTPLEVATAVSLSVGVIQLFLGLIRLGSITVILTDVLISAFTVGASFHVFTSQIKHILGVDIPRQQGEGNIAKTCISIFSNIASTNIISLLISVISIIFLFIVSTYVGPRLKSKCRFPIPSQLIIIIVGTVLSAPLNLGDMHNVKTVGNISSHGIPTGLPEPSLPRTELFPKVFVSSFITAIISYVIGQSLGSMFGSKHGYEVCRLYCFKHVHFSPAFFPG